MDRSAATLRESQHPFYAAEGNFYSNDCTTHWDSWADFYGKFGESDLDMNAVFRWDWDVETSELQVTMIYQRKGIYAVHFIAVAPEDDGPVREWLSERWARLQQMWVPISGVAPGDAESRG